MAKADIKRHLKGAVLGISRLKAKRKLNLPIYYRFKKFRSFKLGNLFKVVETSELVARALFYQMEVFFSHGL
jgi:hypothetical protein